MKWRGKVALINGVIRRSLINKVKSKQRLRRGKGLAKQSSHQKTFIRRKKKNKGWKEEHTWCIQRIARSPGGCSEVREGRVIIPIREVPWGQIFE